VAICDFPKPISLWNHFETKERHLAKISFTASPNFSLSKITCPLKSFSKPTDKNFQVAINNFPNNQLENITVREIITVSTILPVISVRTLVFRIGVDRERQCVLTKEAFTVSVRPTTPSLILSVDSTFKIHERRQRPEFLHIVKFNYHLLMIEEKDPLSFLIILKSEFPDSFICWFDTLIVLPIKENYVESVRSYIFK
jgi:hypothetical protein